MSESQSQVMRDFVLKEAPGVYSFALCLGLEKDERDWLDAVFSEFGTRHGFSGRKKDHVWEPMELRVSLYALAWKYLKPVLGGSSLERFSLLGRDTRIAQSTEEDLFRVPKETFQKLFVGRLRRLDLDQRVLIVLRDLLGFSDEEAMRVVDVRWGIYRHRLHRGRMELSGILAGREFGAGTLTTVGVT